MLQTLFTTRNDWTGLITRITIGAILFPHGAQKLLGAFGGYGFTGTMGFFTDVVHLPWIVGFAVILIEFFGSISLLLGFASRLWSVAIIGLMLGIITSSHLQNGFFMNWAGTQGGEGFEYHLLVIGLGLATLVQGSGKYSVDAAISTARS